MSTWLTRKGQLFKSNGKGCAATCGPEAQDALQRHLDISLQAKRRIKSKRACRSCQNHPAVHDVLLQIVHSAPVLTAPSVHSGLVLACGCLQGHTRPVPSNVGGGPRLSYPVLQSAQYVPNLIY